MAREAGVDNRGIAPGTTTRRAMRGAVGMAGVIHSDKVPTTNTTTRGNLMMCDLVNLAMMIRHHNGVGLLMYSFAVVQVMMRSRVINRDGRVE
jgi:hypothetical protein